MIGETGRESDQWKAEFPSWDSRATDYLAHFSDGFAFQDAQRAFLSSCDLPASRC